MQSDTPNISKSISRCWYTSDSQKMQLQELPDVKCNSIVSKSAPDIGRTNWIELDIPTEGPQIAWKPYIVPLNYREFIDHEIKQLKESGINSRSMSDRASPIACCP